jgi:hypothetical protein
MRKKEKKKGKGTRSPCRAAVAESAKWYVVYTDLEECVHVRLGAQTAAT